MRIRASNDTQKADSPDLNAMAPDGSSLPRRLDSFPHGPATDSAVVALAAALAILAVAFSVFYARSDDAIGVDFYQFWVVPNTVLQERQIHASQDRTSESRPVENIYSPSYRLQVGARFFDSAQQVAAEQKAAFEAAARRGPAHRSDFPGLRQLAAANYRRELETYSTPWLYTVFLSFVRGDYERDLIAYQLICQGALLLAIVVFSRALGLSWIATLLAIPALTAVNLSGPVASDIRVGNVNRLQLGMLALYVFVLAWRGGRRRDLAAGAVLGMAVMFKPNIAIVPVLLLAGWLMHRRFAQAAWQCVGMAGGATCALALSSVFFRSGSLWFRWIDAIPQLMSAPRPVSAGNHSLAALLHEATGANAGPYLTSVLILAALGSIWLGRVRPAKRAAIRVAVAEYDELASPASPPPALLQTPALKSGPSCFENAFRRDVLIVALGMGIGLPAFQLTWLHYFVLVIPLLLNAFTPPLRTSRPALVSLVRPLLAILAVLAISNAAGAALGWTNPVVYLVQLNAATLLVLVLAMWDLAHRTHFSQRA